MGANHAIAEALDLHHWMAWFSSLEPSFMFLLCLPFVVAAAGLFADWFRHRANGPFTTTIVKR